MAPRLRRVRGAGVCLLVLALGAPAFVGTSGDRTLPRTAMHAQSEGSSVALVKVTEQNALTTVGVLGGLAGLALGGVWVGGALFMAGSYLARQKDSDLSSALKGVASGGLEALNFVNYISDKYAIPDKVGSALSEAVDKAKRDNKESLSPVTNVLEQAAAAVAAFDKDVGIKDTVGSLLTSAGDLAAQAVEQAVRLNDEYKVTDKIKAKIEEASK